MNEMDVKRRMDRKSEMTQHIFDLPERYIHVHSFYSCNSFASAFSLSWSSSTRLHLEYVYAQMMKYLSNLATHQQYALDILQKSHLLLNGSNYGL